MTAPDQGRRFKSGLLSLESVVDGGTRTLRVAGELDLASADILQEALAEALEAGEGRLVLDLRRLTFIDSTGIAILISAIDRDGDGDGLEVRFVPSAAPAVTRVLALTGVAERMPLLDPDA